MKRKPQGTFESMPGLGCRFGGQSLVWPVEIEMKRDVDLDTT